MKTEEAIKFLKEKGYKIEEPESRFLNVKFSDKNNVLLEDKWENILVSTWLKEYLNDFEYFEKYNYGHFWINGKFNKFEFKYKGKWLECNNIMDVRFLR